jgi:hypothetical protein
MHEKPIDPAFFDLEIYIPVILPGAERIIAEGGVPAHISTALMFAGLRKLFGLRAEMVGDPVFTPDGRAIERWKLFEITEEAAGE